jgi:hypothetical protein
MTAGLAQLDADALDRADEEVLPDEVVQPDAAYDDLAPSLRAGQADVRERFRLDQRQCAACALSVSAKVTIALETAAGHGAHEVDRCQRMRRPDEDAFHHVPSTY